MNLCYIIIKIYCINYYFTRSHEINVDSHVYILLACVIKQQKQIQYNKIMSKLIINYKQPTPSFSQLLKNRLSPRVDEDSKRTASYQIQQKTPMSQQINIYESQSNQLPNEKLQQCAQCQEVQADLLCLQCNRRKYCRKCFDNTHDGVKFSLHQTRQIVKEKVQIQHNKGKQEERNHILMESMLLKNSKNNRNSILQKQIKNQQNNAQYNKLRKKSEVYLLNLQQKIHRVNNKWNIVQQVFKKQLSDLKYMLKELQNNVQQEIKNKRSQQLGFIEKVFHRNSIDMIKKQLLGDQNYAYSQIIQVNATNKLKQFCTFYDRWIKSTYKGIQLVPSAIQEQFLQAKCFLKRIDIKIILSKSADKIYILDDHSQNISSKDKSKHRGYDKNNISFFNIRKAKDKGKHQSSTAWRNNSYITIAQNEVDRTQVKKVKSQTILCNELIIPNIIKSNKRNKIYQGVTLRSK